MKPLMRLDPDGTIHQMECEHCAELRDALNRLRRWLYTRVPEIDNPDGCDEHKAFHAAYLRAFELTMDMPPPMPPHFPGQETP